MATYKLDIVARLGKFHHSFYDSKDTKKDPLDSKPLASIDEVWRAVQGEIEKRALDGDKDSIIFRNIAYEDFSTLNREVVRGTY